MTLDEARLNFGRAVIYDENGIMARADLASIWGGYAQILLGEDHLRLVDPATLTLV